MSRLFLGVDVGGATNTWISGLAIENDRPLPAFAPRQATLREIRDLCAREDVAAVAIDAQLSYALEFEKGWRPSDRALQERLPMGSRNWVMPFNSLMAVPLRGQMLAGALAPLVGTVVETHPRACLYGVLGEEHRHVLATYKGDHASSDHTASLWIAWCEAFGIGTNTVAGRDGELDALVCATVALAYHRWPERLEHLRSPGVDLAGWGPFMVFALGGPGAPAEDVGAQPTASSRAPDGNGNRDVISDVAGLDYQDVKGQRVLCPACTRYVFEQWPYGWDAHAAHRCAGLEGQDEEVRKATYKARYRSLFRR